MHLCCSVINIKKEIFDAVWYKYQWVLRGGKCPSNISLFVCPLFLCLSGWTGLESCGQMLISLGGNTKIIAFLSFFERKKNIFKSDFLSKFQIFEIFSDFLFFDGFWHLFYLFFIFFLLFFCCMFLDFFGLKKNGLTFLFG